MIEFVRNRKTYRISKLFDQKFRGVRVNYVIYGNSQQLSDRQRKDWSVVAGYALPLKPLLHYGLRNASDHRRTVSTHVPRFIHPRISRRLVSADSPRHNPSVIYPSANTLWKLFSFVLIQILRYARGPIIAVLRFKFWRLLFRRFILGTNV